jgi:hypothetical protein
MDYEIIRYHMGNRRFRKALHVSRNYKYLYIANAKAASSTIKLYLSRSEMNDPGFTLSRGLHKRENLPLLSPDDLSVTEKDHLFDGTHFIFSFVRHPYKRVMSAYTDKILGNKKQKRLILDAMGKPDAKLHHRVSFDDFIAVISDQDPDSHNAHWRAQNLNIAFDVIQYDFIGRLESFETDMAHVKTRLGLPDFELPHRNPSAHNKRPRQSIAPDTLARLEKLYASDLQAFSYSGDIEI